MKYFVSICAAILLTVSSAYAAGIQIHFDNKVFHFPKVESWEGEGMRGYSGFLFEKDLRTKTDYEVVSVCAISGEKGWIPFYSGSVINHKNGYMHDFSSGKKPNHPFDFIIMEFHKKTC